MTFVRPERRFGRFEREDRTGPKPIGRPDEGSHRES